MVTTPHGALGRRWGDEKPTPFQILKNHLEQVRLTSVGLFLRKTTSSDSSC